MQEKTSGGKRRRKPNSSNAGVAGVVFWAGPKPTRHSKPSDILVENIALAGEELGTVRQYRKNDVVFLQGEPADALFYVQEGTVKRSVLSRQGNEATIALLSAGDFFGEGCVTSKRAPYRETATALTDCCVLRITRRNILRALQPMHPLLVALISFLISRNWRVQEDLADQLFNSAEKRLARTLLLLAGLDNGSGTEGVIPNVSQQILAEMIGATRQRVNFFMNRFRELGFIKYDREIRVRQSLRSVLLRD